MEVNITIGWWAPILFTIISFAYMLWRYRSGSWGDVSNSIGDGIILMISTYILIIVNLVIWLLWVILSHV